MANLPAMRDDGAYFISRASDKKMQQILSILSMPRGEPVPSILLRRPYPPRKVPHLSKLGGLPNLPNDLPWPRAKDGTPYHFLAQIELAELPQHGHDLPPNGFLFFFARIDEDFLLLDVPGEGGAVVFTAESGEPRELPIDLPPIGGGYYGTHFDRQFVQEKEEYIRNYPEWSVESHPIETYANQQDMFCELDVLIHKAGYKWQSETDMAWTPHLTYRLAENPGDAVNYMPYGDEKLPFPQVFVMIHRVSRAIAKKCHDFLFSRRYNISKLSDEEISWLEEKLDEADAWGDFAEERGLTEVPDLKDRERYTEWLRSLAVDAKNLTKSSYLLALLDHPVRFGMHCSIQFLGAHPDLVPYVPKHYFERAAAWLQRYPDHQMLGFAPRSQEVRETNEVLLLQLNSDYGVDFMFCDCGEIEFWIESADLKNQVFDNVRISSQGG